MCDAEDEQNAEETVEEPRLVGRQKYDERRLGLGAALAKEARDVCLRREASCSSAPLNKQN